MGAGKMLEELSMFVVTVGGFTIAGAAVGIGYTVQNFMNPDKSLLNKVVWSAIEITGGTSVGLVVGVIAGFVVTSTETSPIQTNTVPEIYPNQNTPQN